ncbi:uncharacterized protein MELLADRAFT_72009 [Melampsora larici-populina 98AG31]|uniref:Nuclear speckle splicing regulatory protein 1 N-terminal domain-containing protein n=1 Tax=Melampsora larici-populina (strain 98AG31 / pathotype 3-4-7) TaxID=747676 RepID=F4RNM0_MELLP|nr:uncharacterized protein MELLADRAFT_72009 [Melampsora larici-populina 98AG31]EGG06066.1 hypothetical protein MELLADRAFT_72009 [Melampsora larici-populina 98AG31]
MSAIKFSIGTTTTKSNSGTSNKRPTTNKVFEEDEEEDELTLKIGSNTNSGTKKASSSRSGNPSLLLPPTNSKLSRQQKLKQDEAAKLDATVFEYDEVYDDMKSAEKQSKLAKEQSGVQRKPQYISGLIETAKQRQIDRVRAEDKMVQRERELEGAEFADKDAFVTPAYLEQQAELRKAEEEEKLKAEKGPTSKGMSSFYKNILDEDSKRNEAAVKAVAAAAKRSGGTSLNLASTLSSALPASSVSQQPQYDPEPEEVPSEAKLAAEVGRKLGRKVDLDDEGRIIDHRQLLTGGLNVGQPKLGPKKPTKSGFALPIAERARQEREKAEAEAALVKKQEEEEEGISQAEKLKLSRERQSLLLQQQLIELESNKRKAEEDQMKDQIKKVARRNDESKVEELKRKAQERRKAREKVLIPTETSTKETI